MAFGKSGALTEAAAAIPELNFDGRTDEKKEYVLAAVVRGAVCHSRREREEDGGKGGGWMGVAVFHFRAFTFDNFSGNCHQIGDGRRMMKHPTYVGR